MKGELGVCECLCGCKYRSVRTMSLLVREYEEGDREGGRADEGGVNGWVLGSSGG